MYYEDIKNSGESFSTVKYPNHHSHRHVVIICTLVITALNRGGSLFIIISSGSQGGCDCDGETREDGERASGVHDGITVLAGVV